MHPQHHAPAADPVILKRFPYALDTFQQQSVEAIEKGDHVLVTAHTSAGKSTVAEYAIAKAFLENRRIIYTSPVKTLSNQKYSEFKNKYGPDYGEHNIGIQTGDVKMNPDAQCIVMTTEILRNMLFKEGTLAPDLGYVVFDEVHYINDKDRGQTWEECIFKLPEHVQMIMLSATIANPEQFAGWIRSIKKTRGVLITSTDKRPVPLVFHMFVPNPESFDENSPWDEAVTQGNLVQILQGDHGTFNSNAYNRMTHRFKAFEAHIWDEQKALSGPVPKNLARRPYDMLAMLERFLNFLHINRQMPAIFFTLSRKRCDLLASRVQTTLITHAERAEIESIFDFYIRRMENHEQYQQVAQLKHLMLKGVAVHHSGLFPILKEIVEVVFSKGLIKVLFATETFAIGINMPTKTVVFLDVIKFNEDGKRPLMVEEFKQMAGRAGRRGLDTVGHVVYFPVRDPVSAFDMQQMMLGPLKRITSKFQITPQYVLRTLAARTSVQQANIFKQTTAALVQEEYVAMIRGFDEIILENNRTIEQLSGSVAEMDPSGRILDIYDQVHNLASMAASCTNTKIKKQQQRQVEQLVEGLSKPEKRTYDSVASCQQKIASLESENASYMEKIDNVPHILSDRIRDCLRYLEEKGFVHRGEECDEALTSAHLTPKGVFANEVSQCHEVVITEVLLHSELLNSIKDDPAKLAAALAAFIDDSIDPKDDDRANAIDACGSTLASIVDTIIGTSERACEELQKYEMLVPSCCTFKYVGPVWEWCNGQTFESICSQYDMFEGNMVRALQKLVNLLDELKNAFGAIQALDRVVMVERMREMVAKGLLTTGSIYIC